MMRENHSLGTWDGLSNYVENGRDVSYQVYFRGYLKNVVLAVGITARSNSGRRGLRQLLVQAGLKHITVRRGRLRPLVSQ
jgi:hypothetical protein